MTYRVEAPAAAGAGRSGSTARTITPENGIGCELAWMKALREEAGVPTPIALAGKDGELIQDVSNAGVPRPRHCVLFDWLDGHEPDESGDLLGPFEELGEISGRLHKHSKGWVRPDNFERLVWVYDHMLGDRPYGAAGRTAWASTPRSSPCSSACRPPSSGGWTPSARTPNDSA